MPKNPRSKLKLLYLRDILNEKTDEYNPMNASELISALEAYGITAERKSIYSDIEELRNYGMDIIQEAKGYYVASRDFEIPELKVLIDVVQSARFLTEKKSAELISKIEKLAPKSGAGSLRRSVVLSGRVKAPNERIYYSVDKIHEAINSSVRITFKYFSYGEKYKKIYKKPLYQTTPIALMWEDENYYLVAYDETESRFRHYRVDKMENVELSALPAVKNETTMSFDRAKYAKMSFNMFRGEESEVTLHMSPDSVGIFADRFGKEPMLIEEGDGSFHATVKVSVSPHFYSWIFGLEGKVRIMSPEKVKVDYIEYCKAMLEKGIK